MQLQTPGEVLKVSKVGLYRSGKCPSQKGTPVVPVVVPVVIPMVVVVIAAPVIQQAAAMVMVVIVVVVMMVIMVVIVVIVVVVIVVVVVVVVQQAAAGGVPHNVGDSAADALAAIVVAPAGEGRGIRHASLTKPSQDIMVVQR